MRYVTMMVICVLVFSSTVASAQVRPEENESERGAYHPTTGNNEARDEIDDLNIINDGGPLEDRRENRQPQSQPTTPDSFSPGPWNPEVPDQQPLFRDSVSTADTNATDRPTSVPHEIMMLSIPITILILFLVSILIIIWAVKRQQKVEKDEEEFRRANSLLKNSDPSP